MRIVVTGLLLLSSAAFANEVRIVDVRAECSGSCTFSVTLEHADTGWDHYANLWEVVTLEGELLGARVLYHPHENEQPFTRSLSGVRIPAGLERVKVRARDSKHGFSDQEFIVDLPARN